MSASASLKVRRQGRLFMPLTPYASMRPDRFTTTESWPSVAAFVAALSCLVLGVFICISFRATYLAAARHTLCSSKQEASRIRRGGEPLERLVRHPRILSQRHNVA